MTGTNADTAIDFGPLTGLIGVWKGDKGVDVAPEPEGPEQNPFYETITFREVGEVENAQSQKLVAVHYHQLVSRKSDDKVFHNETGYWMWDAGTSVLMHSLLIPRAVGLIAGGTWEASTGSGVALDVAARHDDPDWQIIQSPFMRDRV